MADNLEKGLVQVYTGSGKGKTTAAFGQALRAHGAGLTVTIVQFLKDGCSPEVKALRASIPEIEIFCFGKSGFVGPSGPDEDDIRQALEGLEKCLLIVGEGSTDVLILDEICTAVALGVIEEEAVLNILKLRPHFMELILTGRGATGKILENADLITDMQEVKHPFTLGQQARRGIEY